MTENRVAEIKSRYALAGGLWVMAFALVFSFGNSPNFPQQPLGGGVVLLLVVATSILFAVLIASTLGRTRPGLGKALIWLSIVILLVYGILGILSIGTFILPAAFLLIYAVVGGK